MIMCPLFVHPGTVDSGSSTTGSIGHARFEMGSCRGRLLVINLKLAIFLEDIVKPSTTYIIATSYKAALSSDDTN